MAVLLWGSQSVSLCHCFFIFERGPVKCLSSGCHGACHSARLCRTGQCAARYRKMSWNEAKLCLSPVVPLSGSETPGKWVVSDPQFALL